MPSRARTRCRCGRTHAGTGACPTCRSRARAQAERARGSTTQQGYTGEHVTRFRAQVLARDPTCVLCGDAPSTDADHWPRSRKELLAAGCDPNDPQYGRGLCSACHKNETARRQPGGWNRR